MPDERTGRNPLLLDIGCGINKPQGYIGLDREPYPGVDVVRDLMRGLPFVNDTFDGARAHHVLEHFDGEDLIFLVEELWRVCRPGATIEVTVPDAISPNRYRDPTHRTRDWSDDSFILWEVNEMGDYLIYVGPTYRRQARLRRITTATNPNKDRMFRLEVLKP